MLSAPVAVAATGRAKAAVYQAIGQLQGWACSFLCQSPAETRSWEATGLLDLIAALEAGRPA